MRISLILFNIVHVPFDVHLKIYQHMSLKCDFFANIAVYVWYQQPTDGVMCLYYCELWYCAPSGSVSRNLPQYAYSFQSLLINTASDRCLGNGAQLLTATHTLSSLPFRFVPFRSHI
jgi:hypothetical protein